jgi:hypothetical protein
MDGNGCQSPMVPPLEPRACRKRLSIFALTLVAANATLLVFCAWHRGSLSEFDAVNVLVGVYIWVILGFPTTLGVYPHAQDMDRTFVLAYVVNFVVVSYLLGRFVPWFLMWMYRAGRVHRFGTGSKGQW